MFFDFSTEGEWFQFFGSHIDPHTGLTIFEEPVSDGRVRIRRLAPFIEERLSKWKKSVEHVYNPKTRAMERIPYYPDQSIEEARKDREDAWDYAITGIENIRDIETKEEITCTRENKLKLMKVPVFDRFFARCQELLDSSGIKEKEESEKN